MGLIIFATSSVIQIPTSILPCFKLNLIKLSFWGFCPSLLAVMECTPIKTAQRWAFLFWFGLADDFRTLDWKKAFGYPEGVLKQMKELLATA